jgi:flagellar assembly factor FliW
MSTVKAVTAAPDGDSGKIITFPQGIPGFETYTRYTIFHKEEKEVSAYWLESVDTPKVTFTLVDPTSYGLHYTLDLTDAEQAVLEADDPEQLAILMMLSKPELAKESSRVALNANITGPIVINLKNRKGLQKVLVRSHVDVNIIQD